LSTMGTERKYTVPTDNASVAIWQIGNLAGGPTATTTKGRCQLF